MKTYRIVINYKSETINAEDEEEAIDFWFRDLEYGNNTPSSWLCETVKAIEERKTK